jgi:hypothetical protein
MKPRPNHSEYLKILRGLSPEARLRKAFELTAFSQELFMHGLRHRFPEKSETQLGSGTNQGPSQLEAIRTKSLNTP